MPPQRQRSHVYTSEEGAALMSAVHANEHLALVLAACANRPRSERAGDTGHIALIRLGFRMVNGIPFIQPGSDAADAEGLY